MSPQEIDALADRLDAPIRHLNPYAHDAKERLTPEQHDLMWACVNLRRYASELGIADDKRKEGAEYMRGYKFTRVDHGTYRRGCGDSAWHGVINRFHDTMNNTTTTRARWMYEAKSLSDEVPRMILLFERERVGLPTSFKMCAHDPAPPTPLPDNHLRCHLGVECRKCEFLQAIESDPEMTNEAKDEAKAWTCATHILRQTGPHDYIEGYLHDKSDAVMAERMARSSFA